MSPPSAMSYRAVLMRPGALRAFLPAVLGRFSFGLLPLPLLLRVQSTTGSFAVAGAAVGVFGALTLLLPGKARLIDRYGQPTVLVPLVLAYAGALALLATVPLGTASAVGLTAVAGALAPPLGPSMRVRWAQLCQTPGLRQRAFGLDAVVEETLYVVGPLVAGVLITTTSPAVALAVTTAFAGGGGLGLALAPDAPPPRRTAAVTGLLGGLRTPGLLPVLAVVGTAVVGLAALELAVVARAQADGAAGAAGYLLAGWSLGSVTGGLAWGRRAHHRSPAVHLAGLLSWSAAGCVIAAVASPLPLLGLTLALAGAATAPVFVVAYLQVDAVSSPDTATENTTWVNTANNLGSAAGTAMAGVLVDPLGPRVLAAACAVPITLAVIVAVCADRRSRERRA